MTLAGAPEVCDRSPGPDEWDHWWAAERAAKVLLYLAQCHPECAGSSELHPHQDAVHEAAVAGDWEAYLEALRGYIRCGRSVALRYRRSLGSCADEKPERDRSIVAGTDPRTARGIVLGEVPGAG